MGKLAISFWGVGRFGSPRTKVNRMTFPALNSTQLAEITHAMDCQAASDEIDALILDGMEASLLGLNDRTLVADLTSLAIAANGVFAVAVAAVVAL
jgi:hypothetical protein